MSKAKSIETLNFEEALGELETIVRTLETGQTALEDSIGAYERGITLKKHCETKLREAQAKIEKITIAKDGTVSTTPLDAE
jgi:exodeoxyribonuclease VII small subunit